MQLGIWLVREEALELGLWLQKHLQGDLFCPWKFPEMSGHSQFVQKFYGYPGWVLVMTTGIAVRYLEGLPQSKYTDPAVVVLDEGGRFAVSLLSGHEGGANQLAYQVTNVTGAIPVITTATESLKPLVLGIGCRKGVSEAQIDFAIQQALENVNRHVREIREIATIDHKAQEPGLKAWCERRNLPLRIITQALIQKRPWVTKPSEWVQKTLGVDGVCEPSALLASIRGELILKKTAWDGVTVAIVDDAAGNLWENSF